MLSYAGRAADGPVIILVVGFIARPPAVSVSARGVRAIQDGQWKLIEELGSGGFTRPAHIESGPGDPEGQLYNLAEDPSETNNLWQEQPEVVKRLQNQLQALDEKENSHF